MLAGDIGLVEPAVSTRHRAQTARLVAKPKLVWRSFCTLAQRNGARVRSFGPLILFVICGT